MWRDLFSTQRQAREIISGPSPTAKTGIMSFNKTQSRFVSGLLTGSENGTSAHILCECDVLDSLRHVYLGTRTGIRLWGTKGPFLGPKYIGTVRVRTQLLNSQSKYSVLMIGIQNLKNYISELILVRY
jgi:hypothetical protein